MDVVAAAALGLKFGFERADARLNVRLSAGEDAELGGGVVGDGVGLALGGKGDDAHLAAQRGQQTAHKRDHVGAAPVDLLAGGSPGRPLKATVSFVPVMTS